MSIRVGRVAVALLLVPAPWGGALAEDDVPLHHLSLEELGALEVTTVSKVPESLWRTAAAASVLTGEELRRSGATTLAEALRSVPGVEVARIDNAHWSVGVRGFGDQFSKSLLVLIDGRSVYTPLFAGVFWAVQNVPLEDVDRVEVIRGSGGTVWGANAVNGVINVITKSAHATTGAYVTVGSGDVERARAGARYGAISAGGFAYRLYGDAAEREPGRHAAGDPRFDAWRNRQAGFRLDSPAGGSSTWSVHGDAYWGSVGQSVEFAEFAPPREVRSSRALEVSGGNLVARYRRELGPTRSLEVQAYYDRTRYDGPQFGERRDTFDLDLVHRWTPGRHELVSGLGYRSSPGRFEQTSPGLLFVPAKRTETLASAFLQDTVALVPERVFATAGAKLEHNQYTGLEVQPSLRLLWQRKTDETWWAAVSRAVRTPSRIERDFLLSGFLGAPPPTFVEVVGSDHFDAERVVAYELGLRKLAGPTLYVDLALFHDEYRGLAALGASRTLVRTDPFRVVLQFPFANGIRGSGDGFELAPEWRPSPSWRLAGSYSYLRLRLRNEPGNGDVGAVARDEGSSPMHQASLRSELDLGDGWRFDQAVRFVGALPARGVESYTEVDLTVGWRIAQWEVALTGWNLLDAAHAEFGHDPPPTVEVRRSVALTATWRR